MIKRFSVFLAIIFCASFMTSCTRKPEKIENHTLTQPAGIVRMCVPYGDGKYILLFNERTYLDDGTPKNSDILCVYDPADNSITSISDSQELWNGCECQIVSKDNKVFYADPDNSKLSLFEETAGGWSQSDISKNSELFRLSPDASKYAKSCSDGLYIIDYQSDFILSHLTNTHGMVYLRWSADGRYFATTDAAHTYATVWNLEDDTSLSIDFTLFPLDVVDISDIALSGDGRFLIVNHLCESGCTAVIYDTESGEFYDTVSTGGDITFLDISADALLYENIPNGSKTHSLNIYDFETQTNKTADEFDGHYTAGCFKISSGSGIIAYKYDTSGKTCMLVETADDTGLFTEIK